MALSYSESASLMQDQVFRGRVKTACLKFASSIESEDSAYPAHNARLRWAGTCYMNPDQMAQNVTPPTVLDPNVQENGGQVDDLTLQGAVEAVVNKLI